MRVRTKLLALSVLSLLLGILPAVAGVAPADAATGTASGVLDYDGAGPVDDYDLGYTIEVSDTTPVAGSNITVAITWDESPNVDTFGYSDLNICWDAPVGWAGAGSPPSTQDYDVFTPEGTAVNGQVVGTDVPGTPTATTDFVSAAATGE